MRLIQERRSSERLLGQLYIRLQNLHASYDALRKQMEATNQECERLSKEVHELQALTSMQQATIDVLSKSRE